MIKVLIVEDSPVVQEFLVHVLGLEPDIEIIGRVNDGEEAVDFVKRTKPDVITMDIIMPKMNGLEATRRIMETNPVPIVVVSGNWDPKEVDTTFRAMEAGALAIVRRPYGAGHPEHESAVKEMVRTVRLMSEVKVVRRWSRPASVIQDMEADPPVPRGAHPEISVIAIGASAGGPPVLQKILSGLPADFPSPVLIVQHMAEGFLPGMLEWLGATSGIPLHIASDGVAAIPGQAWFAPDGFHMGIRNSGRIFLSDREPERGARPSVSFLFRSVAEAYGNNAAAVLLTGMGSDGAVELKLLKEKGAVTIVQDRESSVIYGMPGAAKELGAALYELSPEKIVSALMDVTSYRREKTDNRRR
ncbi:MAG: chemotaxis-specific protein-glutamate methyltransferase CheB [Nitrospirae bacterium]|nr:chemotaxis-specific protein-glutamate methyltransferase CheB [Nitrospirota bacterium]